MIIHGRNEEKTAAAASEQELQDQLWNKSIEMIKYQEILTEIPDRFLSLKKF